MAQPHPAPELVQDRRASRCSLSRRVCPATWVRHLSWDRPPRGGFATLPGSLTSDSTHLATSSGS